VTEFPAPTGQDRVRPYEEDRPAITAEHAGERGEDRTVGRFEVGPWHLTVQDRELMAQDKDLGVLGTIPTPPQHQQADHEADNTVEVGHPPILAGLRSRRSVERETPGHHAGRVFGTHRSRRVAHPDHMSCSQPPTS
jgi:hypothetical protein